VVVLMSFPISSNAAVYVIPLTPGRGGGRKSSTVRCRSHIAFTFALCSCINSSYASLNRDGKLLLVSNLKDGVNEYLFPNMEKVQTFTHPIDTNCILQTRALPSWNLIVVGGDNGFAWVFNRISSQLVSKIHHGGKYISFNGPMDSLIVSSSPWSACTSC